MTTVKKRFHALQKFMGGRKHLSLNKAYHYIKDEMNGDPDFYTGFWDTEVSDAVWKELLREALEQ